MILSSDLILQASRMLQTEKNLPIAVVVEFDEKNEQINIIDETTNELIVSAIYGED
jgi:hypothetical protein